MFYHHIPSSTAYAHLDGALRRSVDGVVRLRPGSFVRCLQAAPSAISYQRKHACLQFAPHYVDGAGVAHPIELSEVAA